ncbi:MAG: VWA domain-containing protein, partial [Planctomycetaceae bacterium]|nr:VWA domain-containing protein [Planctomycetaceae bacterium]
MSAVPKTSTLSSLGVSTIVHALILGMMATWYFKIEEEPEEVTVESVIKEEERPPEDITQRMEEETQVSTNLNSVSGGAVSLAVGSTAKPTVKKVQMTESIVKTDVTFNASNVTMPGDSELGDELGEGEVTGEVGAVVEGYGPAMDRLTKEIIRMMREQKVLVVWLFDQSDSMKDDHEEIAGKFHKVYEELGIAQQKDEKIKSRIQDQVLQTMIIAYGEGLKPMLREPTADV